jgi:hypothetical protein
LQTEARLDGDHYIVNGQKVWTSYGSFGDCCELVVRTDASVAKHQGLTVLLVDMKSPGVEVRPLRQMTGESEFSELFFRDVRVAAENTLGKVNDGWNVAMSTLMYERGSYGARLHLIFKRFITRLIELSHPRAQRAARGRDLSFAEARAVLAQGGIMRFNQMRAFSRITAPGVPGPEGSSENFLEPTQQRLRPVAQELLGSYDQCSLATRGRSTTGFGRMRTCEPVEIPSKPALPRYNETSLDISFWACPEAIKGTRHAIRINRGPGIFEKQRPQILRWRVP